MKKILSAVLAAAMVLSMGVMAFADKDDDVIFGSGTAKNDNPITEDNGVTFDKVAIVRNSKVVDINAADKSYDEIQPGDTLYFPVVRNNNEWTKEAPADWQIKINNAEYVDGADFARFDENKYVNGNKQLTAGVLYVKVELSDFDEFAGEDVKFYFYVYDKSTKESSDKVTVKYEMASYSETLEEDDLDWVITVSGPKAYKYHKDAKAKLATFDFNEAAFVEVKLFPGETYKVNVNEKFNKDIAKAYPEADFDFVELSGDFDKAADVVIPSSKDNKFIYEVVDGDLVAVEAEYVEDYKFESGEKVDGYLFTTNELGQYAISDTELDLEVEEEVEGNEEAPEKEEGKENPPMGANDFVGAAVALAVVSVAAAGALALKK